MGHPPDGLVVATNNILTLGYLRYDNCILYRIWNAEALQVEDGRRKMTLLLLLLEAKSNRMPLGARKTRKL